MTKKNIDNLILQRLGGWKEKHGSLPQFLELFEQLLCLQIGVKSNITISEPGLSPEATAIRLKRGLPLLKFQELSLEWSAVQSHLLAVSNILSCYLTETINNMEGLRKLAFDIPKLKQVTQDWYNEKPLLFTTEEPGFSEKFLSAVLQTVLRPFLMIYSDLLLRLVDQNLWRHRNCPVCGGKPDFSFLDKEQGARWLICSRCEAEWLFQRLECPYCGIKDNKKLSYRTDDRGIYRLYTCDHCSSYIKAIDVRKAEGEVLPPLERILTLDLDKQALESGYRQPLF